MVTRALRTSSDSSKRRRTGSTVAFLVALAVAPAVLSGYWTFVLTLGVIYAIFALSLVVVTGWSGQLNLHPAALGFGWGSYAAFALVTYGVPTTWALVLAGFLTIPFATVIALVAVRFRGLELGIATLAIGLIFERLVFRNLAEWLARPTPGVTTPFASSFVSMPRPTIGGVRFEGDAAFFYFCLAFAVVIFFIVGRLGRSSIGSSLRAQREREVMAETLGIPVVRYRMAAFVSSIVVAGAAGALFASFKQGIVPDSYSLDLSFQILAATVIGGIYSPAGAVIGGGLMALLPEVVRFGPLQIFGGERLSLVFGAGMILVLWRLPRGIAGWRRNRAAEAPPVEEGAAPGLSDDGIVRRLYRSPVDRHSRDPLLRVDDLRVRFGGVVALDGAGLFVPEGEVCALIGPNGAGKSTLFNCIDGLLTPDEGRVYLQGRDITEASTHRRAAMGVARTFQTIELFREMTVRENLEAAGYVLRGSGRVREALGLPGAARGRRLVAERTATLLDDLGLSAVAEESPADLPLGQLRILEIGMALAMHPRLLLLDEPSAGLDQEETSALGSLISGVRTRYGFGVLLVEHDMSMVARLAEHVYVLDFGRIIAQGTPEEIRRDPLVLERYLGADWAEEEETRPRRRRAAR